MILPNQKPKEEEIEIISKEAILKAQGTVHKGAFFGRTGKWTKDEDNLLAELINKHTNEKLAKIFYRSKNGIRKRILRLGLKRTVRIYPAKTELFKERMRGDGNPFYGKKHTEETKRKISEKNWKGGKSVHQGYVLIRRKNKYVKEHRLVMEKTIGRRLRPEEIVHHKDGNRENNHIHNLELCESQSEHISKHKCHLTGRFIK